jgi:hypothetical protein
LPVGAITSPETATVLPPTILDLYSTFQAIAPLGAGTRRAQISLPWAPFGSVFGGL